MKTMAFPNLDQYLVPANDLKTSEYCYRVPSTDFTKPVKDNTQLDPVNPIVNALLNTSGGILSLKGNNVNQKVMQSWIMQLKEKLLSPYDTLHNLIDLKTQDGPEVDQVHVLVKRSARFVTLDYRLYTRKCTGTEMVRDIETAQRILSCDTQSSSNWKHQWEYGKSPPLHEAPQIEFKCWKTLKETIVQRFHQDDRLHKCMLALPHLPTGGSIFLGVKEDKNDYCTVGHLLGPRDQHDLTNAVEYILKTGFEGFSTIWPDGEPTQGKNWDIKFEPVANTANESKFVVCINLRHCQGGVFSMNE